MILTRQSVNINVNMMQSIEEMDKSEVANLLIALDIMEKNADGTLTLQNMFRRAYLRASLDGSHRCSNLHPASLDKESKKKKRERDIDKKAHERWEAVLRYLALPSDGNTSSVSEKTRKVLGTASFSTGDNASEVEITSAGFQFLLLSPTIQIWTYIIEWLKYEMSEGKNIEELLDVLIRVALCVDGDIDKTAFMVDPKWNKDQFDFLMHMRELGLIFMRKRKDGVLVLTSLMAHVASGDERSEEAGQSALPSLSSIKNKSTGLIVETNFRFNDMSVGVLTRDSVRAALQVGITAEQIISFLKANLHSQAASRSIPIPVTVADQIRLWEDERKRITFQDCALYSGFESEKEFQDVHSFATSEGILLFSDGGRKLVVVTSAGHEKVKTWWKSRTERQQHTT